MRSHLPYDPAHKPSATFKNSLRKEVIKIYNEELGMNEASKSNNYFKYLIPAFAILLVVGGGAGYIISKDNKSDVASTGTNTSDAEAKKSASGFAAGGSAGTSLAGGGEDLGKKYSSLKETLTSLDFKPLVVSKPVSSEAISDIYITEGLSGGSEKSLRFNMSATDKLYEVIQTKALPGQDPLPAEVERVELNIDGKKVTAYRNEFWNDKTPVADIFPGTPRQSISFTLNGVSVDLTEYGKVTLEQLRAIAGSMVEYK